MPVALRCPLYLPLTVRGSAQRPETFNAVGVLVPRSDHSRANQAISVSLKVDQQGKRPGSC